MVHLQLTTSYSLVFEVIITAVVILILIIAIIILRYIKQFKNEAVFTGKKRKRSARNLSRENSSMLSKHGKGLTQKEIDDNLGFPPFFVAQKSLEMEDKGLIVREWENDEFLFTVNKRK